MFDGAELKTVRDLENAAAAAIETGPTEAPPEDDDFAALEDWDGDWEPDPEVY